MILLFGPYTHTHMRIIILAFILVAVGLCAAEDYPSPNKFFTLRVDAKGARLVQLSTGNTIRTIASEEEVAGDDGWEFSEAHWAPRGLCVVVRGRWGNHHRYGTLSVWRFSEYSEKASVEQLDLSTPFSKVFPKDKDRDTEARGFDVADVVFGYGDTSLIVNYRQIGTGSFQWENEPDADYYTCNFTYEDSKPLKLVELRRVRTTVIEIK